MERTKVQRPSSLSSVCLFLLSLAPAPFPSFSPLPLMHVEFPHSTLSLSIASYRDILKAVKMRVKRENSRNAVLSREQRDGPMTVAGSMPGDDMVQAGGVSTRIV